jgi:hypothetical protein
MGDLITLDRYRARRNPPAAPDRLDVAVARLDDLIRIGAGRLTPLVERELLAIAHSVSAGHPRLAAEQAERLAGMLEHPLASG